MRSTQVSYFPPLRTALPRERRGAKSEDDEFVRLYRFRFVRCVLFPLSLSHKCCQLVNGKLAHPTSRNMHASSLPPSLLSLLSMHDMNYSKAFHSSFERLCIGCHLVAMNGYSTIRSSSRARKRWLGQLTRSGKLLLNCNFSIARHWAFVSNSAQQIVKCASLVCVVDEERFGRGECIFHVSWQVTIAIGKRTIRNTGAHPFEGEERKRKMLSTNNNQDLHGTGDFCHLLELKMNTLETAILSCILSLSLKAGETILSPNSRALSAKGQARLPDSCNKDKCSAVFCLFGPFVAFKCYLTITHNPSCLIFFLVSVNKQGQPTRLYGQFLVGPKMITSVMVIIQVMLGYKVRPLA